ncbi:hypothetical protein [Ferruginibacter sp. HRS2-29]|uniref:hypothetical protein n=1 Tax=Ferruginibacter sp. HRS2-29 TaxID=2487334 RepID=UPI0020CBF0FA|nr:hypothetical protein [Ferruginibacter sp. HRS2-29]MCP9751021.1 hypothetical protein [Ferruginibacter sp. HRS2-29]
MKLLEIIPHLKNIRSVDNLISVQIPNLELGLIDVFLKDSLNTQSEVKFFDADAIPNNIEIVLEGVTYFNLFPLAMLQEMVEDYILTNPNISELEIAENILKY